MHEQRRQFSMRYCGNCIFKKKTINKIDNKYNLIKNLNITIINLNFKDHLFFD